MSPTTKSTATLQCCPTALTSLITSLLALENQWISLRDDPRRVCLDPESQVDYLRRLHRWYTTDLPRDKAALLTRINYFRQTEGGRVDWESLVRRCQEACEKWEEMEQLEVLGNVHVYFAPGLR